MGDCCGWVTAVGARVDHPLAAAQRVQRVQHHVTLWRILQVGAAGATQVFERLALAVQDQEGTVPAMCSSAASGPSSPPLVAFFASGRHE